MPLTVVVGGQYGSEGKGKLVAHLASQDDGVAVVRCGGSNAGHGVVSDGEHRIFRQLPSAALVGSSRLYLAAGMQLELSVLRREIEELEITADRLTIDPNATLIESQDRELERRSGLERIGSTFTGTGGAVARKALRGNDVRRAADVPELQPFISNVSAQLHNLLRSGARVIVEGTQGAGLSIHHGDFPYVTSRDTTAAAFLSEAGLAPMQVDEVVLVLRTYPIRVAGSSGPLPDELSWETVRERSECPEPLAEYTSVTGRLRRVAEFDWKLATRAAELNGPTALAVHGLDYLDFRDLNCRNWSDLGPISQAFVEELEVRLGVHARYLFTGADRSALIDRGHLSGDQVRSLASHVGR